LVRGYLHAGRSRRLTHHILEQENSFIDEMSDNDEALFEEIVTALFAVWIITIVRQTKMLQMGSPDPPGPVRRCALRTSALAAGHDHDAGHHAMIATLS